MLGFDEEGKLLGVEIYARVGERVDPERLVTEGFSFESVAREDRT